MKRIITWILPLLGFVVGALGGDMLQAARPVEHDAVPTDTLSGAEHSHSEDTPQGMHGTTADGHDTEVELDWFRFPNQFFVPVMRNGTTLAIMVLTLTIEMPKDSSAEIVAREHRLRDALLNALLVEANTGGFDGNFTSDQSLGRIRAALVTAARRAGDERISNVLIEEIGRQDG
ncbi:hypothetical protein RGQ15_01865 [Paracoccus sp. MBLB3053]|uniref:Flagellar basal body-associated protein FliL n=1 Tax=Paracoccus aurantius TaxID=3073814 RepID=A0ABU2HMQ6_9RHOB|nr:hypothetical protein [Paracoccus sp. MBLB3053]MDS9466319.1 hypothetical protein [Paracoccus sp. MBLB3053]